MAKILVVDDDPRNLRLAVTALEQAGHEALSAEGGAAWPSELGTTPLCEETRGVKLIKTCFGIIQIQLPRRKGARPAQC